MKYLSLLLWISLAHTGLAQVSRGEVWATLPPVARIIGLGESSHGYETFSARKAQWLNEFQAENDDRAVIFESSFTLGVIAYLNGDTAQRVQAFLYPFWNTASVKNALNGYMRAEQTKAVPKIFGCDIQEDCRFTALTEYLVKNKVVKEHAGLLQKCDTTLASAIGPHPGIRMWNRQTAARLQMGYAAALQEVFVNQELPQTSKVLLVHALENRQWLCGYLTLKSNKERMAFRDSLMAVNVFWIYNTFLKNTQTVLWAANSHVNKQLTGRMGAYLSARLGAGYAAVGLFPGKKEPALKKGPKGFDVSVKLPDSIPIPPEQWKTPCGN